jgi:hypothetical protein
MSVETLWKQLGVRHLHEYLREDGTLVVGPDGRSHQELFGNLPAGTKLEMRFPSGKVYTATVKAKAR